MGTTRGIVAEGTEGPINLGPERPRVYSDLSQDEKDRYNADIRATNIILQGLPKDIYSLINHYTGAKDIWCKEDIQCAGSDTRPPMLDKADFASWQQRIRLYCRGKDNGVNILKSIDEGPFQMGTTRVTAAEGTEGPLNLGPERPRVYSDLSQDEKDRYNADIRATNM
ncbi:hypothetical protein Tco_0949068 [Tanacetum coccineum]